MMSLRKKNSKIRKTSILLLIIGIFHNTTIGYPDTTVETKIEFKLLGYLDNISYVEINPVRIAHSIKSIVIQIRTLNIPEPVNDSQITVKQSVIVFMRNWNVSGSISEPEPFFLHQSDILIARVDSEQGFLVGKECNLSIDFSEEQYILPFLLPLADNPIKDLNLGIVHNEKPEDYIWRTTIIELQRVALPLGFLGSIFGILVFWKRKNG